MKLLAAFVLSAGFACAQAPGPAPVVSPQVNADGSITFRYPVAGATSVDVSIDWLGKPLPMTRGADGVWTVTTAPLPPEIYLYAFEVEGRKDYDAGNLHVLPSLSNPISMVEVPANCIATCTPRRASRA